MSSQISQHQAEFIEAIGVWGVETGAPHSLMRVLGFLLICEPVHQSAVEIQTVLGLSSGSVSNALALLQEAELVKRRTFPGDRRYYYEIDAASWKKLLLRRVERISRGVELAESGLAISPGNDRLLAMRDVYEAFTVEVEGIRKRLGPI